MTKERRLSSERILLYAKEMFLNEVDMLLDDPSELIGGPSRIDPRVALVKRSELIHFHQMAKDLGMDFNVLIKERGDEYQRERLRRIMASEPSDHRSVVDVILKKTKLELPPKEESKLIKKGDV